MNPEPTRCVLKEGSPVTTGDVCLLQVDGDLDSHTCPVLEQVLAPLLDDPRVARIELYGRQIAYIDSDGIRVLMHARRALHCRGGAFALRAPSATLRRALAATGLAWLFE